MTYLPVFQAQNPAISHCTLGWSSCTCFAGGMAGDYHMLGKVKPLGCVIRTATGDTSGGTNLSQVHAALLHYGIDLDVRYRYPWADVVRRINAGQGAILQGGYGPIAASRFDAGGGFTGNHAIFVAPGFIGMDPLADGRRTGIYRYHGEAYPEALLKAFAGKLNTGTSLLGAGFAYAAFTRDNEGNYKAQLSAQTFWLYTVSAGIVTGRQAVRTGGFSATCTPPASYRWPAAGKSYSLVRLTSGARAGSYVASSYAKEIP